MLFQVINAFLIMNETTRISNHSCIGVSSGCIAQVIFQSVVSWDHLVIKNIKINLDSNDGALLVFDSSLYIFDSMLINFEGSGNMNGFLITSY